MPFDSANANNNHDIVRLKEVHKVYQMGTQQVRALDGVSITFKMGSFWAIMGPSPGMGSRR